MIKFWQRLRLTWRVAFIASCGFVLGSLIQGSLDDGVYPYMTVALSFAVAAIVTWLGWADAGKEQQSPPTR